MWPKPSTQACQRCGSYQSASASAARPGTEIDALARPISRRQLRADGVDRGGDAVQPRAELARQPAELLAARVGGAVEAARAPLRVLPLAGHQPLRLERAQQRVHRVRVDVQRPARQRLDALDQLVAVRRLARGEVEHQQRQQPRPAQVADQRVAGPGPLRGGRLLDRRARRLQPGGGGGVCGPVTGRHAAQSRDRLQLGQTALRDYAAAGSSMRRGSSVSRAITRRWICDVPS